MAFYCSNCTIFSLGLKTYLISGQKVKEPHCSCAQALLSGLESGDGTKVQAAPSVENTGDMTKTLRHSENLKVSPFKKKVKKKFFFNSIHLAKLLARFLGELMLACLFIFVYN